MIRVGESRASRFAPQSGTSPPEHSNTFGGYRGNLNSRRSDNGYSGLVTMPCGGEHSGQAQRRLGISGQLERQSPQCSKTCRT